MNSIWRALFVTAFVLLTPIAQAASTSRHTEASRQFSVPILMYHYIRELASTPSTMGKNLSVSPAHLDGDLDWLKSHGYHTVTFNELADAGSVLPDKPIILTFDDGYRDAFTEAFPRLLFRGMRATFYIITGYVNLPAYMTWEQLKIMRDAGMELAPHTTYHENLRSLSEAAQRKTIATSVKQLKDTLGIGIHSFAYPYGKYSKKTLQLVRDASIPFAVTTHHGIASAHDAPQALPRIRITDKTNFARLLK